MSLDHGGDFKKKTISGISWSVMSRLSVQGLNFVIGVILARLLSPDDYGLIGMVLVFVGFANVFLDLGFGSALIQKQNATSEHYSSIFWINIGVGLILMLLFMILSPAIARFYNQPELIPLTLLVSTNFFIGSFRVVQFSILTKELNFRRLTIIELSALLVSGIIGISCAIIGFGVYSLAFQSISSNIMLVLLLWILSSWRPRLSFQWNAVKDLLGFSTNLLMFSSLNYWSRNADNMLIGRNLGTDALGIYNRSYRVMLLPITMVSRTISRVMFPAFSTIQDNKPRIARVYLRITRSIALITFPIMIGMLVVSDYFVLAIYGEKWAGMIPILRILCTVGLIQSIGTLNGNIYLSQGRADLQFKVGAIFGILTIGAIIIGLQWGIMGVALAYLTITILLVYPSITIATSLIGISFSDVLKNLWKILACAVSMGIAVIILDQILPDNMPQIVYLTIEVLFGVVLYFSLIHFLKLQAYLDLKQIVISQIKTRRLGNFPSK